MVLDTTDIQSLFAVADVHAGCRVGLCPSKGVRLDGDERYMPSSFQRKVWRWWLEFWAWAKTAARDEPFAVVFNGDALEGVHHKSNTQITANLAVQANIAYEILAPVVELCEGRYYHIRGTEAHGGASGEQEEALAQRLGAIPNKQGQYARDELWKYVGGKRILVHVLHAIGVTGSQAYESSALMSELVAAYAEAGRWNRRPPDVIVRSHRHRYCKVEGPSHNERGTCVVTPGWQGKTGFTFRLPGARQSEPQFGGIMIRLSNEDEPYVRQKVWSFERSKPE